MSISSIGASTSSYPPSQLQQTRRAADSSSVQAATAKTISNEQAQQQKIDQTLQSGGTSRPGGVNLLV